MKTWALSPSGVLGVSDQSRWSPATTEQIYGSIVERTPAWPDLAGGRNGAADELTFYPYPANVTLVLHASDDQLPAIRLEGQTQLGQTFPLSAEAVQCGHGVHQGAWYPLSPSDCEAISALLAEINWSEDTPAPTTLRQCLAIRRAAADGAPVVDQLPDDILLNLSSLSGDERPQGVAASLYPYQVHGWQWLRFIMSEQAGGLLADEMGLGKTLQIITALNDPGTQTDRNPSLVIAPGSLLENWVREIAKFCPQLRAAKHHGPDRTGSPDHLRQVDVVITSYETAIRDLSLFRMIRWHAVVLDEAQYIRNPDTRRAKTVKQLHRQVSFAVTGTPVENRLRDLWSIMDFILPGYLGELSAFEARYGDNDDDAASLEPLVSPLILRRRVKEVAQDLPPRIDIPEILELNEEEAFAYDDVRAAIHREYGHAATLVSLTKLRQFCAHPALLNERTRFRDYTKFQRLKSLLAEVFHRREKVLVFTAFTAMADRIATLAQTEFAVLSATVDGRLPIPERQPLIDRFTAYQGPAVLVLNPRAGGTGLNISAANHVIQYNPEWNPAIEDQAAARAHRRGQEHPVTVRRLIIADTVEEVMNERLQRKRDVADNAIVGVRGEPDDYPDIVAALTRTPVPRRATS